MSIVVAAIKQMRPKQWAKNVFVLSALVFSGQFLDVADVGKAAIAFASFSLIASAGYTLNDWLDREADRKHPKKKFRPIASGALPGGAAVMLLISLAAGGIGLGSLISPQFLGVILAYFATTLSYSYFFKHQVILDVMVLALCYVWRVIGGAVAISVAVSPWLFLCTAFFSLWIGFNKRRAELVQLGAGGGTRKNLEKYSPTMITEMQSIVTGNTLLSYALYTVLGAPSPWMVVTIPFVLYGMFRYIYLVDRNGEGGAPDETILNDTPILTTVVLYGLVVLAVMYWGVPAEVAAI